MNIIWKDLEFFLTRLRQYPQSRSQSLGTNGGFCVSTNFDYESWVYYPESITSVEDVDAAIRFFGDCNIEFMWPVYAGGREYLEQAGLLYAGDLAAMSLDPSKASLHLDSRITFELISTPEQSVTWAQAAWRAFFDASSPVPASYHALSDALSSDRENISLYLAYMSGQPVGTFAVTHEPDMMGVYYFAVLPEHRRQGIAFAMMSEICRLSGGKRIVLQATPIGKKFYDVFGFEDLFVMPVYSTVPAIF